MEYPELERTHTDPQVQPPSPHRTTQKSDHTCESNIQILLQLEQTGCHDHRPVEPIPVSDHPLSGGPSIPGTHKLFCLQPLAEKVECPNHRHPDSVPEVTEYSGGAITQVTSSTKQSEHKVALMQNIAFF